MSLIKLNNVCLTFNYPVLKNISLEINVGDFVILLGNNGSGKSSLLKLVDQTYKPSSGKINVKERAITNFTNFEFRSLVKTLTQNPEDCLFPSLTVLQNYHLAKPQPIGSMEKHNDSVTSIATYLSTFNAALSKRLHEAVHQLSGGEKQSLALALALAQPPEILLLDEHTSALAPHTADEIMRLTQKFVRHFNLTCLLVTHQLEHALRYGNRLIALKNGTIHCILNEQEKATISKQELLALCY